MSNESTCLDCGGITYSQVVELQDRIQRVGISSNISTGSLCVHASADELLGKIFELKNRVLDPGEMPYGVQLSEAFGSKNKVQ